MSLKEGRNSVDGSANAPLLRAKEMIDTSLSPIATQLPPLTSNVVMRQMAVTPTPESTETLKKTSLPPLEMARSASSLAIPTSKRITYQRKEKKLSHPLQEERSLFDVWPASISVAAKKRAAAAGSLVALPQFVDRSKTTQIDLSTVAQTINELHREGREVGAAIGASPPHLLSGIVEEITHRLHQLAVKYPQFSHLNDCTVPIFGENSKIQLPPPNLLRTPKTEPKQRSSPRETSPTLQLSAPAIISEHPEPHGAPGRTDDALPNSGECHALIPLPVQPKSQVFFVSIDGKGTKPFASKERGLKGQVEVKRIGSHAHNPGKGPIVESRPKPTVNTIKRSQEDLFRSERMAIFEAAGLDFSNYFSTYRNLLLWIFREFRDYESYCHQHVVSPEMRQQFERDLREELNHEFSDERARLQFDLRKAREELAELNMKYQQLRQSSQSSEKKIADRDALIAAKDIELAENAEGRVAMLSRINRLEKDLWAQRDAMEGPEAIINGLKREAKALEDKLNFANKALEEANMDKAVLKVRLERLEDLLKERKLRQTQVVPKSELLVYKKNQIDILELNANLEAKLIKLRGAYRSLTDDLQRAKGGQPGTPRPPWHLADDVFPKATTTAQRVHLAMREYRMMVENNHALQREVDELKKVIAMRPRGDDNADSEYILPQMQLKFFYKLGFESGVPSYLRGNGRAVNMKFTLDQTEGFCRLLFLHRDSVRANSSVETVFESFCSKHSGQGCTAQDFAYSFYSAMKWFSFDPFVGLCKRWIAEEIDDTVIAQMEKNVVGCRQFIQTAADELSLGGDGPAAVNDTDERSTELIRRKSAAGLMAAVEAENAAKSLPFSVMAFIAEEPRMLFKAEIVTLITDYFIHKDEELIKRLMGQLNLDFPGIQVDAKGLFRFNGQKRRFSNFVEEILRQDIRFREEMILDYTLAIQSTTSNEGHVSPNDIAEALWKIDPLIPAAYMDELLSDLFEVTIEELHPSVAEKSYYKTPGLDGERVYDQNSDDPLVADESAVVGRLRRRVLQRFCAKSEAEVERLRLEKEAERAKERAEMDITF